MNHFSCLWGGFPVKRTAAFLCVLSLAVSCGKTKKVAAPSPLPEPPSVQPTEPIPPIANPNDQTLQNDEVEQAALAAALRIQQQSVADAQNTVFLSAADFQNAGDSVETARQGTELGLNMLNNGNFIERAEPVREMPSLMRIDLRDFFGSNSSKVWRMIEENAVVKIVSQTARFRNLQFITQKRLPIMHAKIFLETAMQAGVYYTIKGTPLNEDEFWLQQGINRQQQFDERDPEIFMATFQESLIAPDHNRAVRRMEGRNGTCWNTYDVDALQVVDQSNFFKFPFPIEARSPQTFVFNAGEILCRQPNGLFTMALYNAAGVRQDAAPTTVVVNTRTSGLGLDPSITLRDCTGCHTQFVLPVRDDMRSQIANAPFGANDKLLAQIFYKSQDQLDEAIARDNADHGRALGSLGIDPGAASDPINAGVIDKLRDGFDLKELAAFLYMSEEELRVGLEGSQNASNEVGQLLRGGTIGFIAFQAAIQTVIDDLNLFRDIQ
jgi:hypothetical protein